MSEEPLKACPRCKGSLHKMIGSGSGLIFKGSGFYATDYKKGKPCCAKSSNKSCHKK
jgi:predicted nucleic acid-binding Zn ribbon protein